jgi:transposase
MPDARVIEWIRGKYQAIGPELDERARRRWAATEALSLGWGGASAVAAATGLSRNTIRSGVRELQSAAVETGPRRVRRAGSGRKRLTNREPQLQKALETLVEPATRGDPCSPLRWTCKSTRKLAAELSRSDRPVSHMTVARLLRQAGYSLQANRKTREGAAHPDRNAQFEFINDQATAFQKRGQPVISVDTKKKELVGNFRNGGKEWRPKGKPLEVKVHDFPDMELGKVIPYGVYDLTNNEAWVSVGIDHDTAEFAAAAIERWWRKMGRRRFPKARKLYITADGGGSNGSRSRLWKVALQKLANRTGLTLSVSHFPPGTSKWNKIEHRLFCHITQNWRGQPLVSHEIVIKLIGNTTTEAGLQVQAALDKRKYPTCQKVSDEQLAQVRLTAATFHGDWNYTITPN